MTDIDYDKLNEQAALLYDTAYEKGRWAGEQDGSIRSSREAAKTLLNSAGALIRIAIDMPEEDEARVPLVITIKGMLAHTPILEASRPMAEAQAELGWRNVDTDALRRAEAAVKLAHGAISA